MNRLLIASFSLIALSAVACASSSSDDGATSSEAITGSVSDARACAVKTAFEAADLGGFSDVEVSDFEAQTHVPISGPVLSLTKFPVSGVGVVFALEQQDHTMFYDVHGTFLVTYVGTSGGPRVWEMNMGAGVCGAPGVLDTIADAGAD